MTGKQMLDKPLIVGGYTVTSDMIRATYPTVRGPAGFVSADMMYALRRGGMDWRQDTGEASNRLLQRFRKLGLLSFKHGYWWPAEGALDALLESPDAR